jgi:pimeloyl-ACP methyl ester carboxylesterase
MVVRYARRTVPVTGGDLTVGVWGEDGPLVVAAHGITATHQTWALVGPGLGADHRFVAPDLRGRGRSRDLPPPYGMAAHAADLAAVVAAEGGGPAVLVGHSMGGFAVARAVRDHPALVRRAVLVDGGAPFPLPEGVPADAAAAELEKAVAAVVGPAFDRLSMTFASREEYRDFWRAHPAFAQWSPAMAAYADYDLVGEPPRLRPACRPEAALRDAADLYAPAGAGTGPLQVPAVFLRAPRGTLDQPEPLYPPGWAAGWLPGVVESTVADVNHYTITLGPDGAAAVVAAVRG